MPTNIHTVLITVETQTEANDFCYCFIPEFTCKYDDIAEVHPRITVKLDQLKNTETPVVVVRNFECKNFEPKKRWRILGQSLRALSRFKKMDICNLPYNAHDHREPEKSGVYVANSIDYCKNIPFSPLSSSYYSKKRFALTNIWNNLKKRQNRDDPDVDPRNGSVLRVKSFAYTPANKLQSTSTSPLVEQNNNDNNRITQEMSPETSRKKSFNDEENENGTLKIQKQFHSQPKLNKYEYKPLIHKNKCQSMHDMKTFTASVDSFDMFCAESPETSTRKRNDSKATKKEDLKINRNRSQSKKSISPTNSNGSAKKHSKKLSKSQSFSEKKERKKLTTTKPKEIKDDGLQFEHLLFGQDRGRQQRPQSYFWNPTKVVAEIVEMERQQLLEEQKAYTSREGYGKTDAFTSYYDLQRGNSRDRKSHLDKEFNEYLMHQRKILLSTRDSRTFDPLKEGVAVDRLATPSIDAQETKPSKRKKKYRQSTTSESSRHSENRSLSSKNASPNRAQLSNRSAKDCKKKITDAGYIGDQNVTSPASSKDGKQRISTDESIYSKSNQSTKVSSVNSDSDLSMFAIVPGTKLHRKMSLKGQCDRAPINIIISKESNENNEIRLIKDDTLEKNSVRKSTKKSSSSVDDLLSTSFEKEHLLHVSLSANDINDAKVMAVVSARSTKDFIQSKSARSSIINEITNDSKSARSKLSSDGSFKFQPSVEKKLVIESLKSNFTNEADDENKALVNDNDDDVFDNEEMFGTFV